MGWILEVLGELLDSVIGPSTTVQSFSHSDFTDVTLEPTFRGSKVHLTIHSRRVTYRTEFERWYIPNVHRTVYEVVGTALPEHRASFDPKLFEPVVYPMLSLSFLRWTQYPHLYAIHAYLDRAAIPHDHIEV